mmetsp:Transcript_82570/g.230231  ORF Transcript_82570/g.230231 Transcript_82570/m.230231 type:complete len:258 (-) Transcript_82570:1393-2166(-)
MTFSTSRKFKPTARMRRCTKPGWTSRRRSSCGTGFKFVRAPRAGMFNRKGPRTATPLRARRAARRSLLLSANSSSAGASVAEAIRISCGAGSKLRGSRSNDTTRSCPGYSIRTARANPHRPECSTEPDACASTASDAHGCEPWVTNHICGACLGALAASCISRMANSNTSTSLALVLARPAKKNTARQEFSPRSPFKVLSSKRSASLPCVTQRYPLRPSSADRATESPQPSTRHCESSIGLDVASVSAWAIERHSTL